eukprot:scaffold279_cov369-Prasinococcus_capsulatus_cf.AAC.9
MAAERQARQDRAAEARQRREEARLALSASKRAAKQRLREQQRLEEKLTKLTKLLKAAKAGAAKHKLHMQQMAERRRREVEAQQRREYAEMLALNPALRRHVKEQQRLSKLTPEQREEEERLKTLKVLLLLPKRGVSATRSHVPRVSRPLLGACLFERRRGACWRAVRCRASSERWKTRVGSRCWMRVASQRAARRRCARSSSKLPGASARGVRLLSKWRRVALLQARAKALRSHRDLMRVGPKIKPLVRSMTVFWRKVEKQEAERRKQAAKEAEERRRREEELRSDFTAAAADLLSCRSVVALNGGPAIAQGGEAAAEAA